MNDTYTFEDIDTLVWNCLQGSQNAHDYLAYVKTMMELKRIKKKRLSWPGNIGTTQTPKPFSIKP